MNPRRRSDLTAREVEGEVLILDRREERVHQLNATAGFIWECCDGVISIGCIVTRVAERFGLEPGAVEADVNGAIVRFKELGLLASDEAATDFFQTDGG